MNDHASSLNANQSSMPIDLAELVLARTIHLAAVTSLWNPTSIAQPLNALPRSAAPLLTKVALMHLPHVDLDAATKLNDVDLLRFMLAWSKQPGGRPVNYKSPMTVGMRSGSLAALNWWMDESELCFAWHVAAIKAACINGRIDVLEWWAERGFPHLSDMESVADIIFVATEGGHVHVLDWLWSQFPNAQVRFEEVVNGLSSDYNETPIMQLAAKSGCIAVLEWWMTMSKSKLSKAPSLAAIVAVALNHGHVHVLEWCKSQPEVLEQQRQQPWIAVGAGSPLTLAIKNGLLVWIDELDLCVSANEYWGGSSTACAQGDIQALQWLQRKGYLVGTPVQLTCYAAASSLPASTIIDTLEWILVHVDPSTSQSVLLHEEFSDPVHRACSGGAVQVLDWLDSHGYKIDPNRLAACFETATRFSHVSVLDWLLIHSAIPADELRAIASVKISLQYYHDVATWNWWLTHCGLSEKFAGCFNWCVFYSKMDGRDCIAILNLWLEHFESYQFGYSCIKAAVSSGHVEALDWFLHHGQVSEKSFQQAFHACSCEHYPHLLLWWWANAHRLGALKRGRLQWEPLSKPIPGHLMRTMLKMSFPICDLETLSISGRVPMLKYLHDNNRLQKVLHSGLPQSVLVAASRSKQVHVLDWWRTQAGAHIVECPRAVREGKIRMTAPVKRWWLESGLCDTIVDYVGRESGSEDDEEEEQSDEDDS
ncbi:hypothetical protein BCR44DRAFT_35391 [Catenaria anguillulae PL171]|uniref:Ankyrin repeat-containing domain protein n=1 Tax=Catenaria anguillulae PL171 TaxID=765915 RepID=A0A1Y2HMF2_9FUNG|nr:hypothetical protein BCR44DRAFT_35391 [Catenaria anguillulae PL171]